MLQKLLQKIKRKLIWVFIPNSTIDYWQRLGYNERSNIKDSIFFVSQDRKTRSPFLIDIKRYLEFSAYRSGVFYSEKEAPNAALASLDAMISVEYHRLEKSLAMRPFRAGAAQDACLRLVDCLEFHRQKFPVTEEYNFGIKSLIPYLETNRDQLESSLRERCEKLIAANKDVDFSMNSAACGVEIISSEQVALEASGSSLDFIKSRRSVRSFTSEVISHYEIDMVVDAAIKTPSVCNRQAWKVVAITNKDLIEKSLALQNGNRGFSESIHNLFVIEVDLGYFLSVTERNQAWIEGGLFSMTLMLALHARGLGSCPLNWCAEEKNDRQLRDLLNIPEGRIVIMMIAFGRPTKDLACPASPRKTAASLIEYFS